MNEFDKIESHETDRVVIEQDIKKNITFIGSQRKVKGLTMFEFNPFEMTLEPVKYSEQITGINSKVQNGIVQAEYTTVYKLIPKEGCVYVQALNKRVAYKKIAKQTKPK